MAKKSLKHAILYNITFSIIPRDIVCRRDKREKIIVKKGQDSWSKYF